MGGILQTWYEFELEQKMLGPKKYGKKRFLVDILANDLKNLLLCGKEKDGNSGKFKIGYVDDIFTNDSFVVIREDRVAGGYKGKISDTIESLRNDEDVIKANQINHLRNMVVPNYGEDWFILAERLARVFGSEDTRRRFPDFRAQRMYTFFNTLCRDHFGKEDFLNGLYMCLYLVITGELAPELGTTTFIDDEDRKEYTEYADTFHRYGRYSYQSNLMICELARKENKYALFNLGQMYYYGAGIASNRDLKRTYEIYDKLYSKCWKNPLFLWARADFIIEYFDSRHNTGGIMSRVSIPKLDKMSIHERLDIYQKLMEDLKYSEKRGCGSAANLCGNILSDLAFKKYDDDFSSHREDLVELLEEIGDAENHYLRGARVDNTYSYYHLYRLYKSRFVSVKRFQRDINSLDRAFDFLEKSADTENPRAINEMALICAWGKVEFIRRDINESRVLGKITKKSADEALDIVCKHYNDSEKDMVKAYHYLDRVYESSVTQSNFKWPVCNMVNLLYFNEYFKVNYQNMFDIKETQQISERISNIDKQIDDIRTAMSTLSEGNNNEKQRLALDDVLERLVKLKKGFMVEVMEVKR